MFVHACGIPNKSSRVVVKRLWMFRLRSYNISTRRKGKEKKKKTCSSRARHSVYLAWKRIILGVIAKKGDSNLPVKRSA